MSAFARVVDVIFWRLSPEFCGSCVAGIARELHWSCTGRVQELLGSCKEAALISHCLSCSEVAPKLLRSYLEVALLELLSWSCVAGVAREFSLRGCRRVALELRQWVCPGIARRLYGSCSGIVREFHCWSCAGFWVARGAPVVAELLGRSSENFRSSSRVPRKLLCCCTGSAWGLRGIRGEIARELRGSYMKTMLKA